MANALRHRGLGSGGGRPGGTPGRHGPAALARRAAPLRDRLIDLCDTLLA